jgi:hypothetical protein
LTPGAITFEASVENGANQTKKAGFNRRKQVMFAETDQTDGSLSA